MKPDAHRKAAFPCNDRVGGVDGVIWKSKVESCKRRQHVRRQEGNTLRSKQRRLLRILKPLPAAKVPATFDRCPCEDATSVTLFSKDMLNARLNAQLQSPETLQSTGTSNSRYKDVASLVSMLETDSFDSNANVWSDCNIISSMLKFTHVFGRP
jgi:hypothetical protein